jgi:hypothetical protein
VSYIVRPQIQERVYMMKQITRHEAETLFNNWKVTASRIEQDDAEMRVHFLLSNHTSFVVKYTLLDHQKRYFLQVGHS